MPGTPEMERDARALVEPAWGEQQLAGDPHRDPEKAARVQRMFAAIARRYDLNNRLHSFGMDQLWRRRAVREAMPVEGARVLDVACGTGDLAIAFARAGAAEVIGVDFTEAMLQIARGKVGLGGAPCRPAHAACTPPDPRARGRGGTPSAAMAHRVRFEWGDAMSLQQADHSFDIVSIAFGLRNVTDPMAALREFHRVLKPGGRVVILEFDEPRVALLRRLSRFYTHRVMPWTATLIARDRSGAYRYLPRSVETFLDRDALRERLLACGFGSVRQRPLCAGIAVISTATRPAPRGAAAMAAPSLPPPPAGAG